MRSKSDIGSKPSSPGCRSKMVLPSTSGCALDIIRGFRVRSLQASGRIAFGWNEAVSPSSASILWRLLKKLKKVAIWIAKGRDPSAPDLLFGWAHERYSTLQKCSVSTEDVVDSEVDHDTKALRIGTVDFRMKADAETDAKQLERGEVRVNGMDRETEHVAIELDHRLKITGPENDAAEIAEHERGAKARPVPEVAGQGGQRAAARCPEEQVERGFAREAPRSRAAE